MLCSVNLQGLVVPVLRNVERMDYADIEKGISALGKKAKNNDISIEDMDGGTFTIRLEAVVVVVMALETSEATSKLSKAKATWRIYRKLIQSCC